MERDKEKAGKDNLDQVRAALEFIEASSKGEPQVELESLTTFKDVSALAARKGYRFDHTAFAEAMKIHVDRSLERSGVPSWIRYRIHAPVHD